MLVNVGVGWVSYLLAGVFAERALWLGIAAIFVSFGNLVAHTQIRFFTAWGPCYNCLIRRMVILLLSTSYKSTL
jgi:hypothetical protein